jgi:hypothetical protein
MYEINRGDEMENTYTYTARNIDNPHQIVTFTLADHHLSVGLGAPLEQIEAVLQQTDVGDEAEEKETQLWLKPLAVSLLERGVGPFRVSDVYAQVEEDRLRISAWYRASGLALAPVTLIDGQVDNPPAAEAFVKELDRRKTEVTGAYGRFNVLDYWLTWVLIGAVMIGLFQFWRRKAGS